MSSNIPNSFLSPPSDGIRLKKMASSKRAVLQNGQIETAFNVASVPSLPSVRKMKELFNLKLPSSYFSKRTGINMADTARLHEHYHTVRTTHSQEKPAPKELPPIPMPDQQMAQGILPRVIVDKHRDSNVEATYRALEGNKSPRSGYDSKHTTSTQYSVNTAGSSPDSSETMCADTTWARSLWDRSLWADSLWASDTEASSSETTYHPSDDEGSNKVRLCDNQKSLSPNEFSTSIIYPDNHWQELYGYGQCQTIAITSEAEIMEWPAAPPSTPNKEFRETPKFSLDTSTKPSPDESQTWHTIYDVENEEERQEKPESPRPRMVNRISSVNLCDFPIPTIASYSGSVSPIRPSLMSTPLFPHNPEKDRLGKYWDHEWTLNQLASAVLDFPSRSTLRLATPVITFLRQSNEMTIFQTYDKIFPDVSRDLLDNMCAILVANNYLTSLAKAYETKNYLYCEYSLPPIDTPRRPSMSGYGTRLPILSRAQTRDPKLWSKIIDIQKGLDAIFDDLFYGSCGICGQSDVMLKTSVLVLMQVLESRA